MKGPRLRALVTLAAVAAAAVVVPPATATGHDPQLSTPPPGLRGHALFDSWYELAPFGYEEQEWFLTGTATSDDGTQSAPYTTRFIVTRPTAATGDGPDFNGTVLVEWTNVTAQFENAVDIMEARELLMRDGYAYVHVSAQAAGVCCSPLTPKAWDPVRYADLRHPGDAFARDIFRQVVEAIRTHDLAGAEHHVVAAGQSQSARMLFDYLTSYLPQHPSAVALVDGFLVHGLVADRKHHLAAAAAALGVEVLHLLSDAEADASEDFVPERDSGDHYRLWEVAGSAHADFWIGYQSEVGMGGRVLVDAPPLPPEQYAAVIDEAGNYGAEPHPMMGVCIAAGATMPMHYAVNAAVDALTRWVRDGDLPVHGPRFQFTAGGALARDAHGNALGGIRLPAVAVPVATYRSTDCRLGGTTVPFTEAQLLALYPTFGRYHALMAEATRAAVEAGWLLPVDAADQMARVCAARHRWPLDLTDEAPCGQR